MKINTLLILTFVSVAGPAIAGEVAFNLVARGEHMARIIDRAGCHMRCGADKTPPTDAGVSGRTIGLEFPGTGIFWPPNSKSDGSGQEDGTDAEIAAAMIGGIARNERLLAPSMLSACNADLSSEHRDAPVARRRALPPIDASRFGPVTDAPDAPSQFYRATLPAAA
jgi:hypothetical protein